MNNKIFASMRLPVQLRGVADGAEIRVSEEPLEELVELQPFFGGYADDFLADLGFDMVEELPAERARKVKQA